MQQPPQTSDNVTLWQRIEAMQWLARFPALTLMVFLRPDIGYRMVNPLWMTEVTGALIVVTSFTDPANRPDDLLIFALLALTLGLRQRYLRWREFQRGVPQHSFYLGTSAFASLKLPAFVRRERRTERLVDPVAGALAAVLLFPYSKALALWLLFAAFSLRAFEAVIYHREFVRRLDTIDGMVASIAQGELVERFSPPTESMAHSQPAPGIPTGLGGDIGAKIRERKPNQPPPLA